MKLGISKISKRLTAIPFCPPTARVADILQTKVNSKPNKDAPWIRMTADQWLPKGPHGRIAQPSPSFLHEITKYWNDLLKKSNPHGAPGGDGLRFSYFQHLTTSLSHVALWLHAIHDHKRNDFLAWWHTTGTLCGQCIAEEGAAWAGK